MPSTVQLFYHNTLQSLSHRNDSQDLTRMFQWLLHPAGQKKHLWDFPSAPVSLSFPAVEAGKVVTALHWSTAVMILFLFVLRSPCPGKPLSPGLGKAAVTLAQTVQLDRGCQTGGCCDLWPFFHPPTAVTQHLPEALQTAAPFCSELCSDESASRASHRRGWPVRVHMPRPQL